MNKSRNYRPLDDLIRISRTVKIADDLYDVFPISYKSIYNITTSYLFIENKIDFFENLILLSNPIRRISHEFSSLNLVISKDLRRVLFPAPIRNILIEKGRFINENFTRNSAFLSNQWTEDDLEFLSFHDLLIYKILKKNNEKVFIIKIGEEVKAIITGNKAIIINCSRSETNIIKSVTNKRKSESLSLEYFNELFESFSKIAEKNGESLIVGDELSLLFGKIKLGQKEFLTTSNAWFYEYWIENSEDFPDEKDVSNDISQFSERMELIIDDKKIRKLLIELYRNLTVLRRYNFSNPAIGTDLEMETKIKGCYNHLVETIESNQNVTCELIQDSEELKTYLEIKDKKSLLRKFDSMLRFFKFKNYADKFFDKNLINNQKISAFMEEDGVFYRVVGISYNSEEKNKEKGEITDGTKSFFDEGKLSHFTIFDHLTNTKKVITEERQIYVDSKELLQLLMKDFLEDNYSKINFNKNSDLESLVNLFSRKIDGHFMEKTSNQKPRGRKPNDYKEVWEIFIERTLNGVFDEENKDFAQQAFDAYIKLDPETKNKLKFFSNDSIIKNSINIELSIITENKMGGKTSLNDNITIPFSEKFPEITSR